MPSSQGLGSARRLNISVPLPTFNGTSGTSDEEGLPSTCLFRRDMPTRRLVLITWRLGSPFIESIGCQACGSDATEGGWNQGCNEKSFLICAQLRNEMWCAVWIVFMCHYEYAVQPAKQAAEAWPSPVRLRWRLGLKNSALKMTFRAGRPAVTSLVSASMTLTLTTTGHVATLTVCSCPCCQIASFCPFAAPGLVSSSPCLIPFQRWPLSAICRGNAGTSASFIDARSRPQTFTYAPAIFGGVPLFGTFLCVIGSSVGPETSRIDWLAARNDSVVVIGCKVWGLGRTRGLYVIYGVAACRSATHRG